MIEAQTTVPDRALEGAPHPASVTFYEDGEVVDPGAVTVEVDREDGTNLVAAGEGTTGVGAAARTFDLTAAHTTPLDLLKLTWTSPTKGTLTTYVEVVGGHLFTLAQARADEDLESAENYPTVDVLAARTLAEMALEEACGGRPFAPRYFRVAIDGDGTCDLLLPRRCVDPRSITAATVNGDALAADDLDELVLYEHGMVYRPGGWPRGRRNVTVKGWAGPAFPPPRVGRACLLLAKRFLIDSPISDRATSLTNEDGVTQFFVTAGVRDAVFDVPECNVVVERYGLAG